MKINAFIAAVILSAASTAMAKSSAPNHVVCQGDDLTINYSSTSYIGKPMFSVQFGTTEKQAIGSESISSTHTVMGDIVSIMAGYQPDRQGTYVSLIMPQINFRKIGDRLAFETQAVVTTQKTTIGGPSLVSGLVTNSKFHTVQCEASLVVY